MPIRYEIDLPVRSPDDSEYSVSLLHATLAELWDRFGIVETRSVYRPGTGLDPEDHPEWVRFWFDAPDTRQTHETIADWRLAVLPARYPDVESLVVWYRPRE